MSLNASANVCPLPAPKAVPAWILAAATLRDQSTQMSVPLCDYPHCPCIDHSSPMPMNNPSRGRTACHVVFRSLGKADSPSPLSLRLSSYTPPPGTPPSRPCPPAPARLTEALKIFKPSSQHEPPAASHTGERGDATAPQLEPSASSSSLPLLASNLREGQALG